MRHWFDSRWGRIFLPVFWIVTNPVSWRICCINRFTSLCENLFNLLEFLAEAFRLNKFLHSEINLLIQHIIVQDQDGQNNILYLIVHKIYQNYGLPSMILHNLRGTYYTVCGINLVTELTFAESHKEHILNLLYVDSPSFFSPFPIDLIWQKRTQFKRWLVSQCSDCLAFSSAAR